MRTMADVPEGAYFVKFSPVSHEGRWRFEVTSRPWCVALKGKDDASKENSNFSTIESAVRRAQKASTTDGVLRIWQR